MKRLAMTFGLAIILGLPALALGQVRIDCDVWIDTNGDMLPGPNPTVSLYSPVSFDVYIDSKTYVWTYFQAWFNIGPDTDNLYFSRSTTVGDSNLTTMTNQISGGTFFPLDNFQNPTAIGFSGSGFSTPARSGILRLCTFNTKALKVAPAFSGCVTPLLDIVGQYCIVGVTAAGTYSFFYNGTGLATTTCYTISGGTATEKTSWGGIKGLYQ
jgi:hypothetical protein